MIFGTPASWFAADVLSLLLFLACLGHALRGPSGSVRAMYLVGFVVFASVFENIGVATDQYVYDLHRTMLVGAVPLAVPLVEAAIVYVALRFTEMVGIPAWGRPLVVGLLASMQDLTMDPTAIHDGYVWHGAFSAQWNWPHLYGVTYFGIPWFNFSGWYWMAAVYVVAVGLVERLRRRLGAPGLEWLLPIVVTVPALVLLVLPTTSLARGTDPLGAVHIWPIELAVLLLNYAIGVVILLRFRDGNATIELRRDAIVLVVPLVLHVYDVGVALARGLEQAALPAAVFTTLHVALIAGVVSRLRRAQARALPDGQRITVRVPQAATTVKA